MENWRITLSGCVKYDLFSEGKINYEVHASFSDPSRQFWTQLKLHFTNYNEECYICSSSNDEFYEKYEDVQEAIVDTIIELTLTDERLKEEFISRLQTLQVFRLEERKREIENEKRREKRMKEENVQVCIRGYEKLVFIEGEDVIHFSVLIELDHDPTMSAHAYFNDEDFHIHTEDSVYKEAFLKKYTDIMPKVEDTFLDVAIAHPKLPLEFITKLKKHRLMRVMK